MRQHARFKAAHPDCVLFFRMGDFYELFDADAELVHRVLGLTLTQRTEGVPMAGVPYHALDGYVRRLVDEGYRIAICDQIQDPKDAKGVVDRAVTRVLTPGTLVDESLLEESEANLLAAVACSDGDASIQLAIVELSTGAFWIADVPADRLVDELARHRPSEVLHAETADAQPPAWLAPAGTRLGLALTARPAWIFQPRDASERIRAHFGVRTLGGFGLGDDDTGLGPAGALLHYLAETQQPDGRTDRLAHVRPPRRTSSERFVTLDATTLQSLEIERTMRSGQRAGSLLAALQAGVTPMGKRLLREWLCFPLRDREAIERRQEAVAALAADDLLRDALGERLRRVQDVARISGRITMRRATPRDLVALGHSVAEVERLADLLGDVPAFAALSEILRTQAAVLAPLAGDILARCVESPPAHLRDGGLFADGVDAELDEARGLERDGDTWLTRYQAQLVAETEIPSLKVGFNKVFGYYIEVTHTHTAKVPDAFSRKQTLKNAERYITPELKTFESKVTTAQSRAIERELVLFRELCDDAAALAGALATYADAVAALDVLRGFADTARRCQYVRPQLTEDGALDIRDGRHPVLERTLGERFVPNDSRLGGPAGATLALITGPNMAGKSTAIRQTALITLLAHTGSFVPAASATIGLVDRIFTRIGASDELHTGQSTFMVEMTETANILNHATERSLVILDEIGRGTSTLDGLALAWAIAETISDIGCRTLFATHYHELTTLADQRDSVTNLHVSVREWGDEIVFLYRIEPGRTDRSYGIHVAKIAGVPSHTLARARAVLDTLVVQTERAEPTPIAPPARREQLPLFDAGEHPVVDALRGVELERLTPLEAFDRLRALVERARG